jgi:hypothetical protein
MITSALRIAEQVGYQLVLVWSEDTAHGKHFHGPFSDYLSAEIPEVSFPLRGEIVKHPIPTGQSGYVLEESTFDGTDIYIGEWTHNIFLSSDYLIDNESLTRHYYEFIKKVLQPSANTNLYIQNNYDSDHGFNRDDYLGIHVRKGAFVGKHIPDFGAAQSVNNATIAIAAIRVLNHLSKSSVFLSGQNLSDIEEISQILRAFGVKIMTHVKNTFPSPPVDHVNSPTHILKAFGDLLMLQNSSNVLSTVGTTFSGFASIRPAGKRFLITSDGSVVQLSTNLRSGAAI